MTTDSRLAFLFPGQGAQAVGMGRVLYDALPAARRLYDQAESILGYDLAAICFEGPAERLDSTIHSQPGLYVTSLAALEWLKAHAPDAVAECQGAAGLSLGEYPALTFASALSFEDGLRVVQRRGEAMQAAADLQPSGMVSVLGLEPARLETLCEATRQAGEVLQVANLLCPGNTVVSGDRAACERLAERAVAEGAMRTIPLSVAGAFHTPLMASAVERLREALAAVEILPPRIPVYSNVDAQPHADPEEIRELLTRQVVAPVLWEQTMRNLLSAGFERFYEVGPGRVLAGLLKRVQRKLVCENVTC
jgi:[acyl-carrier-protein] S-malonyltransferase